VSVPLDPIPVFMTMHLGRTLFEPSKRHPGGQGWMNRPNDVEDTPQNLLRPVESHHGGQGYVQYRRCLHPEVFFTNWSYVDHLLLPPGTSEGRHLHVGVEEVYYVMDGMGQAQVNEETTAIAKGDVVPVLIGEVHAFRNNGPQDLELMIIGIAVQKWVLDTEEVK
jgi:mannose-6-phosphate isomerase-like protein (cupin superfamily)